MVRCYEPFPRRFPPDRPPTTFFMGIGTPLYTSCTFCSSSACVRRGWRPAHNSARTIGGWQRRCIAMRSGTSIPKTVAPPTRLSTAYGVPAGWQGWVRLCTIGAGMQPHRGALPASPTVCAHHWCVARRGRGIRKCFGQAGLQACSAFRQGTWATYRIGMVLD